MTSNKLTIFLCTLACLDFRLKKGLCAKIHSVLRQPLLNPIAFKYLLIENSNALSLKNNGCLFITY